MKLTMRPNSIQSGSRHHFGNQEGFLLLGVLVMVLLVTIALAIAAPRIAESIRRDKEEETIHRGKQYARAIQNYFAKYNRYPNSIDQLMKTDNVRFLRKRYLDPMTGKDDWRHHPPGRGQGSGHGLVRTASADDAERHYAHGDGQWRRGRLDRLVWFRVFFRLLQFFAGWARLGVWLFGIRLR